MSESQHYNINRVATRAVIIIQNNVVIGKIKPQIRQTFLGPTYKTRFLFKERRTL